MPETFVVTEAMLRHIATKAMGLDPDMEVQYTGSLPDKARRRRGNWTLRGVFLTVFDDDGVGECFSFWSPATGVAACDLLMWLVRERDWVVFDMWGARDRAHCAVQVRDVSAGGDEVSAAGDTLCEAILRAILAATGWEEAP